MKERLDNALLRLEYFDSKNKAQTAIMSGNVFINDIKSTKCGTFVKKSDKITVTQKKSPYVGRGGEKLAGALKEFAFNPQGLIAADIGASTGGFTDCLLQNNCKLVYAFDVGYGQLDMKLRQDNRVISIERINARHLNKRTYERAIREAIITEKKQGNNPNITEPTPVDLVVMDVSFISILKILPAIKTFLNPGGHIISLVKPQFEAQKHQIGKGGIVTDPNVHKEIRNLVKKGSIELGFKVIAECNSPITGADGNKEFFIHLEQ